ncbi:response regulator transcription factor [Desulfobulbus sp. US1]|nr:response regulator transcription factor [Desulfobulbus sp. US4]MCW5205300.1 response regulator transcription factor [Desulfobulbus sp. N2]MCW5208843.1 response regulator transcription factor [Desulfobulbus sp. US1]MCW5210601.1 response regulator transcription factor [Desulfobulbus sp. N3]MCW5213793.1 response regulator transcription factor [Desulfobulbus sp. US5]WLE95941.1 MAG: response regulator transcription factor [Candidatus Electrothrix communis]
MELYCIVIADDHSLIRQGIKAMIGQEPGLQVIAEAADGRELLNILEEVRPDMVIVDISMPQISGIEAVGTIHRLYPAVRILVLTMHSNTQYCYHAVSAGAHGYLLKDDSDTELLPAIQQIRDGELYVSPQLAAEVTREMASALQDQKETPLVHLTKREKEVLQLVVNGLTSKQIGDKLFLSPRTVGHHRSSLLKKFNMKNSVDLANYVVKNSLIIR